MNLTTGILGFVLVSPLNLVMLRVLSAHEKSWPVAMVFLMDGLGLWLAVRGLRSAGVAVALACVANVPLLWWVGVPEAGEWAGLFAFPKFALFLAVGWWSFWRERSPSPRLRWLAAIVASLSWAYILAAPFVSAVLRC